MENERQKKRMAMLSNSIIPWFMGISGDLMFFIAINTLFLTVVKGLSAAQISFLNTITSLAYILLQYPALKIIQKIGNIKSIRIGTIMLLCSSILITFGNDYMVLILGYILYQPAFLFKKMDDVVLENNLRYLKREEDYVRISSKSKVIYSVITTIVALIEGGIFAWNHYLPMYLCIIVCIINILLSFCIFDVYEKETTHKIDEDKKKEKIKISKIMIVIFISFAFLYATISTGQTNSKLFIQYNLEEHFEIGLTATYLGFIIVTSRISRIIGNLIFRKIYHKWRDKANLVLSAGTILAFSCILLGSCFSSTIWIKFVLMIIGFNLILAVRDPIEVYATNVLLKNTKPEQQQKAISYLQLSRRIGETAMSLLFSILLIKLDLIYIIVCLLFFAIISLLVNMKLYKIIKQNEGEK